MPDRVKVPTSIPKPYRQIFIQIIENSDSTLVADCFLRDAQKDIKQHGKAADELISLASLRMEGFTGSSFLPSLVDWREERAYIENLILNTSGNHLHVSCAATAIRVVLRRIHDGENFANRDILNSELHRERLAAIYKAVIVEGVSGVKNKYEGCEDLEQRHEAILSRIRQPDNIVSNALQSLATDELMDVDIEMIW